MQKCLQFALKIFYFTLFCCCCCWCCCSLALLMLCVWKQYIPAELSQNTYLCWFPKSQTLISVALETIKNVSVNYVSKTRVPNTSLPLTHADDSRLVWLIPYTHWHRRARARTHTHVIYMQSRHSLCGIPTRDSIFNAWIIKIPNTTFRLSRTLYLSLTRSFASLLDSLALCLHQFEKLRDEWVSKCAFGFMFPTPYSIHCINWDWWFHIYMFIKDGTIVVAVSVAFVTQKSSTPYWHTSERSVCCCKTGKSVVGFLCQNMARL